MPDSSPCRLLVDPPASGAWNMAVDEMLLEWAAETEQCCWRLYRWQEPTLSLGYFQAYADRNAHAASRDCPVVRRLTGGGAILHDAELTYSFVAPAGHPMAVRRNRLYETVHATLIKVLTEMGVRASFCGEGQPSEGPDEPLLCFQRRSAADLVLAGAKIAGSAQRRRRGAVLQHGSVLLGTSRAAPELATIEDTAGRLIDPVLLGESWIAALAGDLRFDFATQELTQNQLARAESLRQHRYASDRWTKYRER